MISGAAEEPLAGNPSSPGADTSTGKKPDSISDENLRWYRKDELVKRCINLNGWFAVLAAGFETVLEATSEEIDVDRFKYVKEGIDRINAQVNYDQALFVAEVKRSIHGWAGFEIVLDDKTELPSWLLRLDSTQLKPRLSPKWELTGYDYKGKPKFYTPEKVLYFTNLELESDKLGLSEVEPIVDTVSARHEMLKENFPEIVRTLWASTVYLQVDTSGMDRSKAQTFLTNLATEARAGKSMAFNQSITATVVDNTPNMEGLVKTLDKLEQSILSNWGTPRFLVGRPIENRATAFAELEAFVEGPIAAIQRDLKRVSEGPQWYDRWTRKLLADNSVKVAEGEPTPVVVKHVWKSIRTEDLIQLATAAATLWGSFGSGPMGGELQKIFKLLGLPQEVLEDSDLGAPAPGDEGTEASLHAHSHDYAAAWERIKEGWKAQIPPVNIGRVQALEVSIEELQAGLKALTNQAIAGKPLEPILQRGDALIGLFVSRAVEDARLYSESTIGENIEKLSPEEMRSFEDLRDQWMTDWRRILNDAVGDPDKTLLTSSEIAPALPYKLYRAAIEDFWKGKDGVIARLEALSMDLVFKTFNRAVQVQSSKAGFKLFTWITRPGLTATGPCPICLRFEGRTFRRGQFTPPMPAHVGCVCVWGINREE